ncbi:hypothetical protein BB559_006752 [Furculomyces boomerangus]|uniref:CDC20/Fizzy WD40 domain-containing protein n=2 Tax=Harpellales TaxID=61421 RepID=A0A2T9Y0G9_9FUNG|nr:hypothetical protein BB559_006794 [Furculomyces boomerangus]PVU85948.1 hypothetical protein BB559_006752 [Furculomyces boomerangus]PWA03171.1 hypothetical protein BB558_000664 [Smittium angustum]
MDTHSSSSNLYQAWDKKSQLAASELNSTNTPLQTRNTVFKDPLDGFLKKNSQGISSSPSQSQKNQYDRFIPNRDPGEITSSQYGISQSASDLSLDTNTLAYQSQVAKACGVSTDSRILRFNSEPPTSDNFDFKKIYKTQTKPTARLNNKRRILANPERVLDAPGLTDDYYLNLMDWSVDNILAIGLDTNVYLWEASTGEVKSLCEAPNGTTISSVKWSDDGSYLSVSTSNGDIQIWDSQTNTKVRTMTGRQSRVSSLSWNNHILSSGCRDGAIWHHDVRIAKHKVAELISHTGDVCGLKWRSDGALLASGGNDNLVNIWDIRSSVPKFTKSNHTAAVKAIGWCPWQLNLLATGGGTNDKHIHFWNTTTTAKLDSIDTGSQVTSLIWSKNYKEIMSTHGFPNNSIVIWSYPSLDKIVDIPAHDSRVLHSAISPDHQTVATVASDENLKFWKLFEVVNTGAKMSELKQDVSVTKNSKAGIASQLGSNRQDKIHSQGNQSINTPTSSLGFGRNGSSMIR